MAFDPTEWMPGVVHLPLPDTMDRYTNPNYGNWSSKRRDQCDGAVFHTAASDGTGAAHHKYWSRDSVAVSCHFYVDLDGTITQLVARSRTSYTSVAGSVRTIGIETQGWPNQAWTDAQVKALARIIAWAAGVEGWPIQAMADRRPGTKGVGYHDQGGGGESWNPNGHYCPGDLRVAQIPLILSLARSGETTTTTPAGQEEEEEEMMKGATYLDRDGKRKYMLFNEVSGFCSEFGSGSASPLAGSYINPMAQNWKTGSWPTITASHAEALKRDLAMIRGTK